MSATDSDSTLTLEKTHGAKAWVMWLLAASFYFYEFLLQVAPNVMAPNLMTDFQIDASGLGLLAAFYFYAYAGMQLPVGLLVDRFGPRRLLFLAALICAGGTFLFSHTHTVAMAEWGRLLTGLGSAFAVIGCLKVASCWFPHRYFALITGLMMAIGMTGAVFGQAPLSLMIEHVGWRDSLWYLSLVGLGLAFVILVCLQDHPQDAETRTLDFDQHPPLLQQLVLLMKNPQIWLVSAYGCLLYAAIAALGALWGDSFLVVKSGVSHTQAAEMMSFLFIGFGVGAPLFGWFSDYLQKRKPVLYLAALGTSLSLSILLYWQVPTEWVRLVIFACGFFISAFLPAFTVLKEISPHAACATALAFMNMLNMAVAAAAQPFIGWALDWAWSGVSHAGVPVYTLTDYQFALTILPVSTLLSLVLLPFIKETHCHAQA